MASCSTIDHFGASRNLYLDVKEAGVIHNGENLSPHSAIYVKIKIGNLDNNSAIKRNIKRVSWNKATEDAKENFRQVLSNDLLKLDLPDCVNCTDLKCESHAHSAQIEDYSMSVLQAIESSCETCLPTSSRSSNGKPRKGILPGWNEYVKSYADENRFWTSVWRSAGRPNYGTTFERMRH